MLLLVFLLLVRYALGLFSIRNFIPGKLIRVTGNPINIHQDITKCIFKIDRFIVTLETNCARISNTEIRVIGTIGKDVINGINGNLVLQDAKLEVNASKSNFLIPISDEEGSLNNFREFLVLIFKKFVPEPEAGLLAGIVLGYKKDIGQEFYRQMITSGSIHIAVASGYNILLVGGLILSFSFWFCKRRVAVLIAIISMIFYSLLAGGDPPVVRAVWMAAFLYIGKALGRGNLTVWILTLTAWLMLMIEPSLISSASFQLSLAASYGLMMVEPWLSGILIKKIDARAVGVISKSGFLTTISTMIMTMPILWWHFGRMSLIGILSNSLILPFVPIVMLLGSGIIILPWVFAIPAYVFSHWIVMVIRFFGN